MELAPAAGTKDRLLIRPNLDAAASFVMGGSLFAVGALLAQLGTTSLTTVYITYLVGGFFFSLGATCRSSSSSPRPPWPRAAVVPVRRGGVNGGPSPARAASCWVESSGSSTTRVRPQGEVQAHDEDS
jgi:hypothetical protein